MFAGGFAWHAEKLVSVHWNAARVPVRRFSGCIKQYEGGAGTGSVKPFGYEIQRIGSAGFFRLCVTSKPGHVVIAAAVERCPRRIELG